MLTTLTSVIIVLASVLATLGFLFALRRRLPPAKLKDCNDAAGFYITIIGTIYAVITGFMLSGVWVEFDQASINAEREANCLVSVFRLAGALPTLQQTQVRDLARKYAEIMVNEEWSAMARRDVSQCGIEVTEQMWQSITHLEPHTSGEQNIVSHLLDELTNMTEYRRIRQLQSKNNLPGVLWLVLILGGIITISLPCLFGIDNVRLHVLYVTALACLVSVMLVAIGDIDSPFQGSVRVAPSGFKYALETFDKEQYR